MKKETNMTTFVKTNFEYHGGYLHYNTESGERKFVARFKHRGPVTKAKFLKTLIKHYTVEEYFSRLNGQKVFGFPMISEAPLQIFERDGHLEYRKENGRINVILDGKVL
jgi:hypothetical protein